MGTDKDGSRCSIMPANLRKIMFNCYKKEVNIQTKEFAKKNLDLSEVKFDLLQLSQNKEISNQIFNIADFYNKNYTGNRDFIHIPNLNDILKNAMKYPIIFASKDNYTYSDSILGVTTIKHENNKELTDNPYFPTVGEDILFITGILTKLDIGDETRIRGIGKSLFKSAIRGAYYINKKQKVRLICEADCRNKNSVKAISKAVEELQLENVPVELMLNGYYEIINKQNKLKEAPTFLLEINLEEDKIIEDNSTTTFSYSNCEGPNLLENLSKVIKSNTKQINKMVTKKENIIVYHQIKPINALNIKMEVENSAKGNERIPSDFTYCKNVYQKVNLH